MEHSQANQVKSSLSDPFEGSSVVFSAASGSVGEYPADSSRQPTTCFVAKNNPSTLRK